MPTRSAAGPGAAPPMLRTARRGAGDRLQRLLGAVEAEEDGARELAVEQQEVDHVVRRDTAVALAVHLEAPRPNAAGRPTASRRRRRRRPRPTAAAGSTSRRAAATCCRRARADAPAGRSARPRRATSCCRRRRRRAGQQLDLAEELVRVDDRPAPRRAVAHREVEAVDLLPHLGRDHLAHRAGVLARLLQAGEDRVGVLRVGGQELR